MEDILQLNNEMISIKILIDNCFENKNVYIPLLQRNYKWGPEEAATLVQDLWYDFKNNFSGKKPQSQGKSIYTIGMITFYDEKNGKMQLIDGQQRIITLTLLLRYLNPKTNYFIYDFERDKDLDEKKKRRYFIEECLKCSKLNNCEKQYSYTDINRFKENYEAIKLPITIRDIEDIVKIFKNLEVEHQKYISNEEIKKELENKLRTFAESVGYYKGICSNNIKLYSWWDSSDFKNEIFRSKLYEKMLELIINIGECSYTDKLWNVIKSVTMPKDDFNSFIVKLRQRILEIIPDSKIGIEDSECKGFIEHILNNVYVLLHITDSEPIDEFLNINKNKTRFVISDYIKAKLIMDTPKENKKARNDIVNLFGELSTYLYGNPDIWELIKRGYECDTKNCDKKEECFENKYDRNKCDKILEDVNRLKVLFCDRYNGNNPKGYEYKQEHERLLYYRLILESLKKEIGSHGGVKNWNAYNAFCCLYECKKIKFFDMFGMEYDNEIKEKQLDEVIWSYFSLEEMVLKKMSKNPKDLNYFFESQLYNDKVSSEIYKGLPSKSEEGWVYIMEEKDYKGELEKVMNEYIEYRKGKLNLRG
ncbi:DUF262 domain-containing protein [Clostridium botulinum]|uniref:DUF262 domain-containing protein n=1 Tax=Clostridium botulinum TaxID=1491 RepID=UPI001E46EAC1|nr:DUF262 domain-containing protein [Clostridium botulinum]MCD3276627.1 DUF262 domain-containing protein [Clostridium botulinum C/D]MCD3288213.1 DUF262 domain-containing protein [Clostridium botulinum C/D]MCD3291784.1 DUF262 domain-containing protein [Clostridium botulinum C/D]MCD3301770.1 DUF262 domain-containing protein [Clostridium botulinum C/D]